MGQLAFEIETRPDLEDAGLRSLYEYWRALGAAAGGLPALQSFDALHLPKLLPNIWILEVEPDSRRFRMRLTGENINLIYGRNIAGQYSRDVFEPSDVGTIVARYSRALGEPAIFHASGSVCRGRAPQRGRAAGPAHDRALRRDRHPARRHRLSLATRQHCAGANHRRSAAIPPHPRRQPPRTRNRRRLENTALGIADDR
jgi:hypothetical protein